MVYEIRIMKKITVLFLQVIQINIWKKRWIHFQRSQS